MLEVTLVSRNKVDPEDFMTEHALPLPVQMRPRGAFGAMIERKAFGLPDQYISEHPNVVPRK